MMAQSVLVMTQSDAQLTSVPPLRSVRLAQGMSLRKAAALSGIDPGHLSKVERGERRLSLDALYRLDR